MDPIFDCRASPDPEDPTFAVATTKGLRCFRAGYFLSGGRWSRYTSTPPGSNMLSVEWLSRNVVAGGFRNGRVCLYDVRSESSCTPRIFHARMANKIRRADETRIVVAGFDSVSSLSIGVCVWNEYPCLWTFKNYRMYDLRPLLTHPHP